MSETAIQTEFRYASDHAYERVWERFGVEFKKGDWRDVVLDILDTIAGSRRAAMLLSVDGPHGRERWLVQHLGVQIRVIYDPRLVEIITVESMGRGRSPPRRGSPGTPQGGKSRCTVVDRFVRDPMDGWE